MNPGFLTGRVSDPHPFFNRYDMTPLLKSRSCEVGDFPTCTQTGPIDSRQEKTTYERMEGYTSRRTNLSKGLIHDIAETKEMMLCLLSPFVPSGRGP